MCLELKIELKIELLGNLSQEQIIHRCLYFSHGGMFCIVCLSLWPVL